MSAVPDSDPLVNGKALSSLRVVDLKQELEKRGMSKTGTKKDLMEKLRLRLHQEQCAPSAGAQGGGDSDPVPDLRDEEPKSDFVKAYLAEQRNLIQQQVIAETPVADQSQTPLTAAEPIPEPSAGSIAADEAEDLSPKHQTRVSLSPRTSASSPQPTGRRSLRSGSVPPEAEDSVAPQTQHSSSRDPVAETMPAADSVEAPVGTSVPLTPPPGKIALSEPTAPADTAVDEVVEKSPLKDPVTQSEPESAIATEAVVAVAVPDAAVQVSDPSPAAGDATASVSTGVNAALDSSHRNDGPESVVAPATREAKDEKADAKDEKPDAKDEKPDAKDENEEKKESEAGDEERSLCEKWERRRLVTEKREDLGEESKSKPKRKWGSGSERQIRRGISSSQLNSLLPKKEKVSPGGQEESQTGDHADNVTISGKPFSQPANGSARPDHQQQHDDDDGQSQGKQDNNSKPMNGQSGTGEDVIPPVSKDVVSAQNPASNVLFVENLTRPFTLPALHSLLKTYGTIDTDKFWIDKIKSKCMIAYSMVQEAETAQKALNGMRWPLSNPRTLTADFSSEEEIERRKSDAEKAVVESPGTQSRNVIEKNDITIRKTFADDGEAGNRAVRDWDREKVSQLSPPAKRSRRSPSPSNRSDQQKQGSRKTPEGESPAKLLDDLFKKTSSSPIIYWLPLNEEQAGNRVKVREERDQKRKEDRQAREALRQNRRSPAPPVRPARSPRPPGRPIQRPGEAERSRMRSSRSQSRSRSPVRRDTRYRSPHRRSPPRRR